MTQLEVSEMDQFQPIHLDILEVLCLTVMPGFGSIMGSIDPPSLTL